jgi:hypothetical protein
MIVPLALTDDHASKSCILHTVLKSMIAGFHCCWERTPGMSQSKSGRHLSYFVYSLILIVVAQSLDFITTYVGTEYFGVESEGNTLLRALLIPYGVRAIAYHALGVIVSTLVPFFMLSLFIHRSRLSDDKKQMWLVLVGFLFSMPPMIAGSSNLIQIWMTANLTHPTKTILVFYVGAVSLAWLYLLIKAWTRKDLMNLFSAGCISVIRFLWALILKVRIFLLSKRVDFLSQESRRVMLTYLERRKWGEKNDMGSIDKGLRGLLGPAGILLEKVKIRKRKSAAPQSS